MRPVVIGLAAFLATLVIADFYVTSGFYTQRVLNLLLREGRSLRI